MSYERDSGRALELGAKRPARDAPGGTLALTPWCRCTPFYRPTSAMMLPSGSLNHAALVFPVLCTSPWRVAPGKS